MSFEPFDPQEGVDFLIDLYKVAGVQPEVERDELMRSINQRYLEYHPDRLQGLAPEFQAKGERMAVMLNRARVILGDPEKRQQYDEILSGWDGPISDDGTPVATMERYLQKDRERQSPDEIEALFTKQADLIDAATGHSASRLSFLEKMVVQAGDDVPDDLRAEYEAALLSYDRALAIQEAERASFIRLPSLEERRYQAGIHYGTVIAGEIEMAREAHVDEQRLLAIGGVSGRLALLAGEEVSPAAPGLMLPLKVELPAYFDAQAEKVRELAERREAVVAKRLGNFQPNYPEMEIQTVLQPKLVIGIGEETFSWFGVALDTDTLDAGIAPIPPEAQELLDTKNYVGVIQSGYNVITFPVLEQIAVPDLLLDAIEKHVENFRSGTTE